MNASALYRRLARARRRWFARHPERVRRLRAPVVSVGGLAFGGSGKTPVAAEVARVLLDLGERPSILSRGYRRDEAVDGVVVVRDAARIRADLARAGDEPLMLARRLHGAAVLVSPDRHLAGRIAEARLGCTVHVLDDGFQHHALARDADLLVVAAGDLDGRGVMLREPVDVARVADAVLIECATDAEAVEAAAGLGVDRAFRLARSQEEPRLLDGRPLPARPGSPVVAFAGIARPRRFFESLASAGYTVASALTFDDHHRYTARDMGRIAGTMAETGAWAALTTEKDAVRLLPLRPLPVQIAWVPLVVCIEPAADFRTWLAGRLAARRTRGGVAAA